MGVPRPAFPKTLREFQSMFATEEACQKYLAECRWPDGFVCPRCGNRSSYEIVKAAALAMHSLSVSSLPYGRDDSA